MIYFIFALSVLSATAEIHKELDCCNDSRATVENEESQFNNSYFEALTLQLRNETKSFSYKDQNPFIRLSLLVHAFFQNEPAFAVSYNSLNLLGFEEGSERHLLSRRILNLATYIKDLNVTSQLKQLQSIYNTSSHLKIWLDFIIDPTDKRIQDAFLKTLNIGIINEKERSIEFNKVLNFNIIHALTTYCGYNSVILSDILFNETSISQLEQLINFSQVKFLKLKKCSTDNICKKIVKTDKCCLSFFEIEAVDSSLDQLISQIISDIRSINSISLLNVKNDEILRLCILKMDLLAFTYGSTVLTDDRTCLITDLINANKNLIALKLIDLENGQSVDSRLRRTQEIFTSIASLHSLKSLCVDNCDFRTINLLKYFKNLEFGKNLVNIAFLNNPFFFASHEDFIGFGACIKRLNIQSLSLVNIFDWEIAGEFFISGLPELRNTVNPRIDFIASSVCLIRAIVIFCTSTLTKVDISRNSFLVLNEFTVYSRIKPLLDALAAINNLEELNLSSSLKIVDVKECNLVYKTTCAYFLIKFFHSIEKCKVLNISDNKLYDVFDTCFNLKGYALKLPSSIKELDVSHNGFEDFDSSYLETMFSQLNLEKLTACSNYYVVNESQLANYLKMIVGSYSSLRSLKVNRINILDYPSLECTFIQLLMEEKLLPEALYFLINSASCLVNVDLVPIPIRVYSI